MGTFELDMSQNPYGDLKDGDGISDGSDFDGTFFAGKDYENDHIEDSQDNCYSISNIKQAAFDNDGQGDACDNDIDGDG